MSNVIFAEGRFLKTEYEPVGDVERRNAAGQLHCAFGPAIVDELANEYWLNGQRHRVDGPAVEYAEDAQEYWVHGVQLSEAGFEHFRATGEIVEITAEELEAREKARESNSSSSGLFGCGQEFPF